MDTRTAVEIGNEALDLVTESECLRLRQIEIRGALIVLRYEATQLGYDGVWRWIDDNIEETKP